MTQHLNNHNKIIIYPTLIGNKVKARPAVSLLYPENNHLTYGERVEELIFYCDIHNLKLIEIYDLKESDVNNILRHQLEFSKILYRIQERNHANYPIALIFETFADINHIECLWELTDRINEMVADGIMEVHVTRDNRIFSGIVN